MIGKVNRKKFFLSTASLFLALGLIFSAVQERRRIEDGSSNVTSIEQGDVKGANGIMGALCGQGTYQNNGCTACDLPSGWTSCGADLTYLCGTICYSPSCGANACEVPYAPTALLTNGLTNPTNVTTPQPYFSAYYQDSYGNNNATAYEIEVNTSTSFSTPTMVWASGETGITPFPTKSRSPNIGYNGTTLQSGTTYYWRIAFLDALGAKSPWSATAQFTMASGNSAPTAPTAPLTNGYTNPVGITTPTPYFSAIFNDPDSGDTGVHYQIQVNTNSSFTGTTMWDNTKTSMTATANGSRSPNITYNGSTLQAGTTYYWRVRFWDNNGEVSPWSATAQFTMNTIPTAPTSPLTNGETNPTGVTTPTPYFSAIFNDPDSGDTGVAYSIHVNTSSSFGSGTTVWQSGTQSMTPTANGSRIPNITYGGTPLVQDGTTYYWRIQLWDANGSPSPVSTPTAQFTMEYKIPAPTGLRTNGLTNPTGVTTPYPKFSAIYNNYPGKGNATHVHIQVFLGSMVPENQVWSFNDAIPNVAPGNRIADITYGGNPLPQDGATYVWRIRFWDGVAWFSDWSAAGQFTMASGDNPTAPTSLLVNGKQNPTGVTTPQPYFSAIFNDPNTGDTGTHYRIQVNTNSSYSGTMMWDSGKTAMSPTANGSRSPNITYNGSTLQAGQQYYWRIKFWDNTGLEGYWSSSYFIMNTPPTAPTAPLTNGQTNPTDVASPPYFSAIFNDADSGDEGKYYQIQVNTNSSFNGTTMWDSGKTSMTSTAPGNRSPNINYAGNTLSYNGNTYYWRIKFWDKNNIESPYSATAQFTTVIPGVAPTLLRTNNLTNPTNVVPSPAPYFSAVFNHSNPSRRAVHYQIKMMLSGILIWDSGKTSMTSTAPGSRCANITYNGSHTLDHNGNVYTWNIVFWDDLGQQTATSAEAQFTMNKRPTPPTGLLTEGQTNPTGVTDTTPEFSAIYNNSTGKPAVYYQIQVNTQADFNGYMKWDSGQVSMSSLSNGSRTPDISYAGSTLTQNGQTFYWKIRFWDNIGGDGEWSEANYFTMKSTNVTFTISPNGTQVPTIRTDQLSSDKFMGGVYAFSKYSPYMFGGASEKVTSITLQRTWVSGNGTISWAALYYYIASSGETCPTTMPGSVTQYASITNPYGSGNSATFTGDLQVIGNGQESCIYVMFRFTSGTVSTGSVLDFVVTNFTTGVTADKVGLPANISGTTRFVGPPTFTNITNNGPKDPGTTIAFNATASSPSGDNVKLVVCKTQGVTGTACDGGDDDTYCTSSLVSSNPSCSWDIPTVYPDGSYYAYPYIFDSNGIPSNSSRQGAAHTFTVNNVAPLPRSIIINGGEAINLITESTKSVTLDVSVRDNNGCGNNEIATTTAYMYRSGVGYTSCDTSGETNPNNCYPEISCTFVSCTGVQADLPNVANYTCTTNLQYYADPTDAYSPFSDQSWVATVKATDNGLGSGGTNPLTGTWGITDGVNVNSLLAFNVTQELSYGTVLAGVPMSPLSATTTITSAGNVALDHLVSGEDMCEDYPTCSGSKILVNQQKYSLNSSTEYLTGTVLTGTPANVFTNLPKQTTSTPTSVNIWWGILAPSGTAPKQYTGRNTITSSVAY